MSGPQSAAGLGIHLHTGTPLWKTKEILWGFFFRFFFFLSLKIRESVLGRYQ